MPGVLTLTPADYAVLKRVSREWCDENVTGAEIARALDKTSGDTMRRLSRLVTIGLVQRRDSDRGPYMSDVRRLAEVQS